MGGEFKFERRAALFTAIFIIAVVVFLVVRNEPFADTNLVVLMRIILAAAMGAFGGTIPGFLKVNYNAGGFSIRAAGALALFVIAYFGTPHVEALHLADDLKLRNEITRHLANRNNCDTAFRESLQLIKLTPNDAVAQNLKGNAAYCLGRINDALAAFEESTRIDPKYRSAQYNRAAALIRLGRYDEAVEILRPLVKDDPDYISGRYNLALAEAVRKNFSEALTNFEFVYSRDKSFDSSIGLGFLYILYEAARSEEKSVQQFKIAISIKPSTVCVLYGKLSVDPDLQEEKPFLALFHYAEKNEVFLRVRANFDKKISDAICENPETSRGGSLSRKIFTEQGQSLIVVAQRCCAKP